ncbi:MAG TPA: hypothetical protein VIL20_18225 [Sandaracinaceae bacterium]
MPLNLDAIAPQQRELYVRIGRQYSSELVLAQADDTAAAAQKWAAQIAPRGFGPRDLTRLQEAITAHLEAGTQRGEAKADVRAATEAYGEALKQAKQARREADSVLRGARSDLADAGNTEVVKSVDITLERVRSTGSSAPELREQLSALRTSLVLEPVAAAAADRGGPEAVAAIDAALTALREAEKNRPGKPGTPAETEKLDLLDGIIVDLVRRARRAGRAAARALGQPHIAGAFELDALYARPRRTGGGDPTPAPGG